MSDVDNKAEPISWRAKARIEKWSDADVEYVRNETGVAEPTADQLRSHRAPTVEEFDDNGVTTAGLNRVTSLVTGAGGQAATATATRIGVGDGGTAFAVGQTDLQAAAGATHRQFKTLDGGFPTQANGVMTFQATFGTGVANFAWLEWCVDIGTPTVADGTTVNALMLNRRVPPTSMGTKTGGSWTISVTVTLA